MSIHVYIIVLEPREKGEEIPFFCVLGIILILMLVHVRHREICNKGPGREIALLFCTILSQPPRELNFE